MRTAAGHPLQPGDFAPRAARFRPGPPLESAIEAEELHERLDAVQLVDTRSPEEFSARAATASATSGNACSRAGPRPDPASTRPSGLINEYEPAA